LAQHYLYEFQLNFHLILDEKNKQESGAGEVQDGRSIYLSSDACSSYQRKNKSGRLRRHRFISSFLSKSTVGGCQQSLEQPALRPTISQRSHLMPIISSHHTVVFIVVTLLHSLFTSGRTLARLLR